MGALEGVAMEIVDCAFPLLGGLDLHDNPDDAFDGVEHRAARRLAPAHEGHGARRAALGERQDLHRPGPALNEHAGADDVKVLVVGNPANTNCLIAMNNAPDIPRERFTAMMRLDHNRAVAQLAAKLAVAGHRRHATWACGATTRRRCTPTCSTRRSTAEQAAAAVDDQAWIEDDFLPNVGKRGAAIIEARGASSRGIGGERRDRPRPRLGLRHRRRLGLDGRPLRRLLRSSRGV